MSKIQRKHTTLPASQPSWTGKPLVLHAMSESDFIHVYRISPKSHTWIAFGARLTQNISKGFMSSLVEPRIEESKWRFTLSEQSIIDERYVGCLARLR